VKLNPSSIQSLMQNLKIHSQSTAGSSGNASGNSGNGIGGINNSNNSSSSLQGHMRTSSNKFGNMVLGHRDGGLNSRSGLSFAANPNASNSSRSGGNTQMTRDVQFRPH